MDAAHSQLLRRKNQSITPGQRQHDADDPPELRLLAAGQMRQRHVHAVQPGQHGERHEDRRDDRQDLHDLFSRFDTLRQVRVEQARDAVLEEHRFVRQPHEVVVDVAEAVGQLLRDLRNSRRASRPTRVALRQDDAAERRDVRLEVEDLLGEPRLGSLEDLLLELVEPVVQARRPRDGSGRPSRRRCGAAGPTGPSPRARWLRTQTRASRRAFARCRGARSPGTARRERSRRPGS